MIDYSKFQKALKHLETQFDNYINLEFDYPDFIKEGMAESVIQRFEVCYDCMWKILKKYLIEVLALPDVPNSPNGIFYLAHENDLLSSPIEEFFLYAKARIGTSHDYSGEKAQEALELMPAYINDAIGLYQIISNSVWE